MEADVVQSRGAGLPAFWPRRVFYGWMIVFISFLASMLSSGIAGYGFGAFIRILSDPVRGPGWSRSAISLVSVFRNFGTVFAAPVLGRYADRRRGPQALMASGALASGIVLLLLSRSTELWHFYVLFGVVWGVSMMALGGQILGPAVVSKWFVRKRGRALGIATMGVSAGGVIVIPLTTLFISLFGWRGAWSALGVVLLVTILPLGAFFMRREPGDVGLFPDGDSAEVAGAPRTGAGSAATGLRVQGSYTVRQAFGTRAFWALVVTQTLSGMGLQAALIHQIAYVEDKGFSFATATVVATAMAFFAAAGKVPWGMIAERVPVRFVMGFAFALAAGSMLFMVLGQTLTMLYLYAVGFGLGVGSMPPLSGLAWANYFGPRHQGALRGWATPLTRWTSGVTPFMAGLVYDRAGSYDLAFFALSATWAIAALAVLTAGAPKEPPSAETTPAVSGAP